MKILKTKKMYASNSNNISSQKKKNKKIKSTEVFNGGHFGNTIVWVFRLQ